MTLTKCIKLKAKAFKKNKFLMYGLPFLTLMLGGSFGLREFAQIRYQFSNVSSISAREADELNKKKKVGKVTLEEEYDKIKDIDIDNWENKRGPRPWEENTSN